MSTGTAGLQRTGSSSSSNHNSNNVASSPLEDFHFSSSQLLSLIDSKDEAVQVLKSDLMEALNKEVKSLDEDSWMFEGPRSRINLISKPGSSFATRNSHSSNQLKFGLPKQSTRGTSASSSSTLGITFRSKKWNHQAKMQYQDQKTACQCELFQ